MVTILAFCLSAKLATTAAPSLQDARPPRLEAGPTETSNTASLELLLRELQEQLAEQRELIDRNSHEIAAQRAMIDALRQRLGEAAPVATAETPQEAAVAPSSAVAADHRIDPELPQKFLKDEFPGSINIPGTDSAFKIGGQARATFVHSLQPLGEDDRFITSSIPVGVVQAGDQARTTYTAAPSRLNLDVRTPTLLGGVRTFLEFDFSGSGTTAHLRHAFIQGTHWLFGQTWSTFSDPEAQPTDIDFEGLNAISLFRQAQFRYTNSLRPGLNFSLAIENPAPDLTNAVGVNITPDFVARLRWDPPKPKNQLITNVAHVQAAVLARALRGQPTEQPDTTLSTGGVGVSVSGVLLPKWDSAGRVKFATNDGWGIGRYVKDLEALGGQDAVYDPLSGQLRALGIASGYVGYEHQFRSWFEAGVTYGIVRVANLSIQPDDVLSRTQRASVYTTWSPVPHSQLIAEFLFGDRVNKDGEHGSASQAQIGWKLTY